MERLKERILAEGAVRAGGVLKVDSFLNHPIDIGLCCEIGREFYRLFGGEGITKILTIEASGIGIACLAAQYFGVPVLFAKKGRSLNVDGELYVSQVYSFTHQTTSEVYVSRKFLHRQDRVLILDDFLANGKALTALFDLVRQAGAEAVGAGIVIEKGFQGGGDRLRAEGRRIESLAIIDEMAPGSIRFR